MDVFVLQHVHELEDGGEDLKFIGVYPSEDAARNAIVRLRALPGFCESPEGFQIDRYTVGEESPLGRGIRHSASE
jgi:hypothetical protein